jgi:predicted phosphoribosyltransferase
VFGADKAPTEAKAENRLDPIDGMKRLPENVVDLPQLRDKTHVFSDRFHAGDILSDMIQSMADSSGLLLGIPAGGVPVACRIQEKIGLEMDLAVISKITLPWNTEAGYGAVAFDGTVRLNQRMLAHVGLTEAQIQQGTQKTLQKVNRRMKLLRGEKPFPQLNHRTAMLVDDGLASGFTMRVAIESIKNSGAKTITVAVPTGHLESVRKIAEYVDRMFCPNIRSGMTYAVADAYKRWSDVTEDELMGLLNKAGLLSSENIGDY